MSGDQLRVSVLADVLWQLTKLEFVLYIRHYDVGKLLAFYLTKFQVKKAAGFLLHSSVFQRIQLA